MRKQKLIDAIRETIIDLQTGRKKYSHGDPEICNCGLLAQNLGVCRSNISRFGFYKDELKHCKTTGANLTEVFQKLFDAGLTDKDIIHLENLSDPKILSEVGIELERYVRHDVIQYLQAWLRILEREPSEPKEEPKYKLVVTCSEKVKQLAKEEIIYS